MKVPRESELGPCELLLGRRERLAPADAGFVEGERAAPDPRPKGVEVRTRADAVHLDEGVGAEGGVVRADDAAALVDPDPRRDVDDAVEVRQAVLGVDEARMLRLRGLDPRARILGT